MLIGTCIRIRMGCTLKILPHMFVCTSAWYKNLLENFLKFTRFYDSLINYHLHSIDSSLLLYHNRKRRPLLIDEKWMRVKYLKKVRDTLDLFTNDEWSSRRQKNTSYIEVDALNHLDQRVVSFSLIYININLCGYELSQPAGPGFGSRGGRKYECHEGTIYNHWISVVVTIMREMDCINK